MAACAELGLTLALVVDFPLEGTRPGLEAPVALAVGAEDVNGFRKRANG